MKLLSVGIPIICLMFFSVTADMDFNKDYDYEKELNRILSVRTELLSQAYFGKKDCKKQLEKVLADPLLTEDLNNIEINADTDIEKIYGFEIQDCQLLSQDEDGAVVRAIIKWKTDADFYVLETGEYDEEIYLGDEYTIIFQKPENGKLKISGMFYETKIFSSFFLPKKKEIEKFCRK